MAIERIIRPYELLVRWGADGAIQGAHVQFIEEIKEGAQVIAATLGNAQPVALAAGAGFPLSDILDAAHIAALKAADLANAATAAAETKVLEMEAELTAIKQQAEALRGELQDLKVRRQ